VELLGSPSFRLISEIEKPRLDLARNSSIVSALHCRHRTSHCRGHRRTSFVFPPLRSSTYCTMAALNECANRSADSTKVSSLLDEHLKTHHERNAAGLEFAE
jgi:hypothetical protein